MAENIKVEMPTGNPSHRLFMTPELMKEAYPEKRQRHKLKKMLMEEVIPNISGTVTTAPQPSKGRNAKRHAYKRAKRLEQN